MAALGDSTTRAYLDCGKPRDCPEASWATGGDADIRSHAARLGIAEPLNAAVSGATVADLVGQAEQVVDIDPDYVTIMIGVNDACRSSESEMTPVATYAAAFEEALAVLDRTHAKVLVASNPDLFRIWLLGHERPEIRESWERSGICASMLGDPDDADAPARRTRVRAHLMAYNAAMGSACAKHRGCRYDGGAVFGYEFTLAEISTGDYWHASRLGQRALAETTWRAGYWPT
ncbi:MAG TPA: GDSL-type esterase/lipase family protein [Mycobacteriales bacterium]|jgi:lysophospholipase L1-like esterase|nr:GDSL-type esterase/lipase family protein [Mycobacteriales bacterium]